MNRNEVALLEWTPQPSGLPLRVFNFRQPDDIPHAHTFHELVVVRRGKGVHLTENGGNPVRRGDVLLIPPGLVHTYVQTEQLEIANILFIPEKLSLPLAELAETQGYHLLFPSPESASGIGALSLNDSQLRRVEGELSAILIEQQHRNPGWRYFVRLRFMALLGTLCRARPEPAGAGEDEFDRLTQVTNFIEAHYAEPLSLDLLAKVGGRSKCTLIRMFRRAFDRTPIGYLMELRLERSARQLRSTTLPVAEIAVRNGFPDSNYFTKLFHRRYHMSPRSYRA